MFSRLFSMGIAAFAGLALMGAGAEALAQVRQEREFTVSRAGLDLNNEGDAARMYDRIAAAATEICQNGFGRRPHNERHFAAACVAGAIENAVEELDAPGVTAVHTAALERPSTLAMAH